MANQTEPKRSAMMADLPQPNPNRLCGPIMGMDYLSNEVPPELLEKIVHDLLADDVDSGVTALATLSRTSRRLQNIFEPMLYDHNLKHKYKGHSAIVWGAKHNKLDVVKKALSYGADINIADRFEIYRSESVTDVVKGSSIHYAVHSGYNDMVHFLIEAGASLETGSYGLCSCSQPGRPLLFVSRPVSEDPMHAHGEIYLPLHVAICQKQTSTAELLLKLPISSKMTNPSWSKWQPDAFHTAAAMGEYRLFPLMVEKAVAGMDTWNYAHGTPADARERQIRLVNNTSYTHTPMEKASNSRMGNVETIKALFQLGAELNTTAYTSNCNALPLGKAILWGFWDRALVLFELGATITTLPGTRTHFLVIAAVLVHSTGRQARSEWYLVYPRRPLDEWLPGRDSFIRLVLTTYPDVNREYPLLSLFCHCYYHDRFQEYPDTRRRDINLLVSLGADPNACFGNGNTALFKCMQDYKLIALDLDELVDQHIEEWEERLQETRECIITLLNHGAEMQVVGSKSSQPQHCKCPDRNVVHEAMQLLRAPDDYPKSRPAGLDILQVLLTHSKDLSPDTRNIITTAIRLAEENRDLDTFAECVLERDPLYCVECWSYIRECHLEQAIGF